MDFTISLSERDVQKAAALQARLELKEVSLLKCEADGAGPPINAVEPVRLSAEVDSEGRRHSAGVDFEVTLRVRCAEPLTFHVVAAFIVRYRFIGQVMTAPKAEVEAFRKSHAVLTAWPYLREFVQSMTARMGFPTESLPLLRIVSRKL
jgi:preprotein translocase subunit SecB